ncbi:MAG: NADH:flavin oxidoreductase / NADH oxidase, partial [Rhizobiales bacterium 32-66-8]
GGFDGASIKPVAAYQVPFAKAVRDGADIPTMAVGLLGDVVGAEAIVTDGEADFVALARGALDDPNWALHARHELGAEDYDLWPRQTNRVRERDRSLGLRSFQGS